jgi:hypothetical protein
LIRSRNQNSFLAVATLGVYLGLILAGATPSVLAQAATAKQFSVKDEIGRSDELDKKPDGCDSLQRKVLERHAQLDFDETDLLQYISGLQDTLLAYQELKLGAFQKASWEATKSNDSVTRLPRTTLSDWRSETAPVLIDAKAGAALQGKVLSLSNWFPSKSPDSKPFFSFAVLQLDGYLVANASVARLSSVDAHMASVAYDAALDLYRCSVADKRLQYLLRNTEVDWADDHLTITTRLPRGSLDTLVASNAK